VSSGRSLPITSTPAHFHSSERSVDCSSPFACRGRVRRRARARRYKTGDASQNDQSRNRADGRGGNDAALRRCEHREADNPRRDEDGEERGVHPSEPTRDRLDGRRLDRRLAEVGAQEPPPVRLLDALGSSAFANTFSSKIRTRDRHTSYIRYRRALDAEEDGEHYEPDEQHVVRARFVRERPREQRRRQHHRPVRGSVDARAPRGCPSELPAVGVGHKRE